MAKREKTKDSATSQIVTYNKDNFKELQALANRNGTTASAIISNFIDSFVAEFSDKPQTLDSFVDPDYVPMPKMTDSVDSWISWLKTQDTRTLEELDIRYHMAHVFARVLAKTEPSKRKGLTTDYPYVWRTFYR